MTRRTVTKPLGRTGMVEVTMNAGLKVDIAFGKTVNTGFVLFTAARHPRFKWICGWRPEGKWLIVSVEQNQDVLCINSQSHTISIEDRLFVNIRYECQ